MPTTTSHYLRIRDVANELDVTPATLYNWIKRGQFPAIQFGGRSTRVDAAAFEEWKASRSL